MLNDSDLLVNGEGNLLQVHPLNPATNESDFTQVTGDLEIKRDFTSDTDY